MEQYRPPIVTPAMQALLILKYPGCLFHSFDPSYSTTSAVFPCGDVTIHFYCRNCGQIRGWHDNCQKWV